MDYLQDSENGTIVDVLRADLDISRRIEDVRCNSGDDAKRDQALVQLPGVVYRRTQAREKIVYPFVNWRIPKETMYRMATECAQRTVGLRRAMAGQHA